MYQDWEEAMSVTWLHVVLLLWSTVGWGVAATFGVGGQEDAPAMVMIATLMLVCALSVMLICNPCHLLQDIF